MEPKLAKLNLFLKRPIQVSENIKIRTQSNNSIFLRVSSYIPVSNQGGYNFRVSSLFILLLTQRIFEGDGSSRSGKTKSKAGRNLGVDVTDG